jgi:hypothetical protein
MPESRWTAPDTALTSIREIVPADLLVPPMPHERRWLLRDECALVLDQWLRRLARQEALGRCVLGRIASVFLARRSHHRLGFARLGDYARERLGISGRELQSVAHVTASLERLPKIRDAFERGEVSSAALRILVDAASDSTEDHWLSLARARTVRALDALRKPTNETPSEQHSSDGDDDAAIDGEPRARFRLSCPRRVSSSWRRAVELARRMSGEELTGWQAAEAIAAEGLSASDAHRSLPETAPSSPEPRRCVDPDERRCAASCVDWSVLEEVIPEPVENLGRDLDDVDEFELDARMRAVLRSSQRIDWQIGRPLRLFLDMRLHRMMGFESASGYLRERLGMSARKGRALMHLERQTARAPELAGAYRGGEVSWVRALAILPVISEAHAREWVERAKSVTVRRLVDEVEWAVDTRDTVAPFQSIAPPPFAAALVRSERQMCAREERPAVDDEVAFAGPASAVTLLQSAVGAFARDSQARWRGLERLLDHVIGEWTRQPRHRDPVFARDGWRCAVPACSSRRNLHDHHILFRSRGGVDARDNRVAVCAWHHLRGLHLGLVHASGKAPGEIRWVLGSSSMGRALEFFGDGVYAA